MCEKAEPLAGQGFSLYLEKGKRLKNIQIFQCNIRLLNYDI